MCVQLCVKINVLDMEYAIQKHVHAFVKHFGCPIYFTFGVLVKLIVVSIFVILITIVICFIHIAFSDWSILYVVIAVFLVFLCTSGCCWALKCLCQSKKPRVRAKPQKYSLLGTHDDEIPARKQIFLYTAIP